MSDEDLKRIKEGIDSLFEVRKRQGRKRTRRKSWKRNSEGKEKRQETSTEKLVAEIQKLKNFNVTRKNDSLLDSGIVFYSLIRKYLHQYYQISFLTAKKYAALHSNFMKEAVETVGFCSGG